MNILLRIDNILLTGTEIMEFAHLEDMFLSSSK